MKARREYPDPLKRLQLTGSKSSSPNASFCDLLPSRRSSGFKDEHTQHQGSDISKLYRKQEESVKRKLEDAIEAGHDVRDGGLAQMSELLVQSTTWQYHVLAKAHLRTIVEEAQVRIHRREA